MIEYCYMESLIIGIILIVCGLISLYKDNDYED